MRKLICLVLVLFMMLSLAACPKESQDNIVSSSGFTANESQTESENNPSSKEDTSPSSKISSSGTSANNHKHKYEKTVKVATCGQAGGNEYTCSCGDSYIENRVAPSYKHDFQQEYRTAGENSVPIYVCTKCGIDALYIEEWWKYKAKFDEVRWYVSGKINLTEDGKSHYESDYEVVVCGSGDIEDFDEKTGNAPWRKFLGSKLKSVTVDGGITSIGKNAFSYRTSKKQDACFNIGGSVKTIKNGAIKLNIHDIVLGQGVEAIEAGAISGVQNVYLPESVRVCCDLGSKSSVCYYYEGVLESLLKIEVENPGIVGNQTCTLKEYCDWYSENNQSSNSFCTVILNSSKIGKGNALFDGKTVKTDNVSLTPYINK